jgi:tetratricopeptide (TPR) repeat protein
MKGNTDRILASRRTWGLLVLALALPATAAALMPRGGAAAGPDTTALTAAAPLPDYCLAPNAEELTSKCPPGIDPGQMGTLQAGAVPEAAAGSIQREDRNPAAGTAQTQRGPGIGTRPDDPRSGQTQRRIEDLIKREIELTQRLLRTTPDTDATKPDIYFRLAQLFYEMQDNRNFQAGEFDMQALDQETAGNTNAAQALYQQRDQMRQQALEWSDKAIEAYYSIVENFPDWSRAAEALFFLAFAFEERARDTDDPATKEDFNFKARTVYNVLISNHQDSPYVANAYLSFAEYYFNEEGNMAKAIEYYDKILGLESSRVYGYSLYKKAWCLYNLQEYTKCLETFEQVIQYAEQNPENADSGELLRTARLELPQAYAQTGRPDQAWRYFERVGGDLTVKMMESLAEYYYSQGEHDNAIIAYHELMDKNRDSDKLCDYQYWVTQSRMAQATTISGGGTQISSGEAKQRIIDEISNMVNVWKLFVVENGSRHSADTVTSCTWFTADFCVDTAVRWHREAAGSEQMPGTNDRETMQKAADLYKLFLDNFGSPGPYFYDQLQPPPEWEYQNPYSVYKATYFAAELLWKSEQWQKCGEAFDAVVQANPGGEYAAEAAYASVLCYKKQYDEEYQARTSVLARDTGERGQATRDQRRTREGEGTSWGTSIPASREFTASEASMEQAFHRYICYIETHEDLANVKFNRAFLFLDANKWQEAAVLFKQIAAEYKDTQDADDRRIAVLSAMNYFEIVVRLSRAGVTQCTPEVIAAANQSLDGNFPSSADASFLENADERTTLDTYLEAVPVLHCQQMLLKVKELTDGRKWEQAAELALKIHDEFPQQYPGYRCLDSAQQDMMPSILNEAANYFENANKVMKAIQIRNRLVQEHPGCPFVNDAQFKVAQAYARLAFFEKAAEAYEGFARDHAAGSTADERAPEAMLNAVQIRIGLGQDSLAKADADFLDQKFGSNRKYQKKAAEAYFSIGDLYTSTRNWSEVIRHYTEYLQKYGRKGGKEFEVRAHVWIAEANWSQVTCTPEEEDPGRKARCRTLRTAAFEAATKANGLVELPAFTDEPAEGESVENVDPAAVLAQRRETTWTSLVEELAIEVEADTEQAKQAMVFVRADKVANAIGQARFYIGEKLYEQFQAIGWPEFQPDDFSPPSSACAQFRGSGEYMRICISMEKYKLWTEKKFVPFAQARDAKIQEARKFYDSIAYLQVPAWEIAAASRVGDMFLQFWKDMYNAPTPPAFQREEFMEVEQAYREQLDVQAEPLKTKAIEAFGYCLATATREQWFNEYSQRCEEALYEIDPSRYRVSNEVYAQPLLNRLHYATPDLDLSIITTTNEFGEVLMPVEPVPGAPAMDDQSRYRFFIAPPPAAPAPAAPAEGEIPAAEGSE